MTDLGVRLAQVEDQLGEHGNALSLQGASLQEVMLRVDELTQEWKEMEGEKASLLKTFAQEYGGRWKTEPKFKSEFPKSFDESLFVILQFLTFMYAYAGALGAVCLAWIAVLLFQFDMINWSGAEFKVPTIKVETWFGPLVYFGYIVPLSWFFFWINASCEFVASAEVWGGGARTVQNSGGGM